MKQLLIIAAACLATFSAQASCGYRGIPNEVCPDPVTPTVPTTGNVTGTQNQQQQQAQLARSRSTSSASVAGTTTANGNGAGAGSNNPVTVSVNTVGGSGDGDGRSLALALPSVPMTPPSFVAGAVVTTTVSACGPLQRAVAEPVYGEHNGLFSNSKVWLGNTEKTDVYLNERGDIQPYSAIGGRWFGHQVIYSTAALGVSSASNLTIGGGASSGGWGQGGGGSSGAMQRLVTTVQLRFCDVGPMQTPIAPTVFVQRIYQPIQRPVVRRAPVRKATVDQLCMTAAAAQCRKP